MDNNRLGYIRTTPVTRDEFFEEMKRYYLRRGKKPNMVYFPNCRIDDLRKSDEWGTFEEFPPKLLGGCLVRYIDGPLRFELDEVRLAQMTRANYVRRLGDNADRDNQDSTGP